MNTNCGFQRAKGQKVAKKGCFLKKTRYFSSFGPLNATIRIHKEKIKYQYNI